MEWKEIRENISFLIVLIQLLIVLFVVTTVYVKTTPELGFCPSVLSGSRSSTDEGYPCKANQFDVITDNEGYFKIEAEIFNKGLVLSLDTELQIELIGSKFEMSNTDNERSKNLIDNYEDNQKTGSSTIVLYNNKTIITERIHVLKPTDSKKITKIFPENFGFYVRPSEVVFTLKENGNIVDTKIISVNYSYRDKCRVTSAPYPPFPITILAKSDNNPVDSASVTITNLQTGKRNIYTTNKTGEMNLELVNFDVCWNNGDVLQINACKNNICKENYSMVDASKRSISLEFNLSK